MNKEGEEKGREKPKWEGGEKKRRKMKKGALITNKTSIF